MSKAVPPGAVMNTVCPVCGGAVPGDMPPLDLSPRAENGQSRAVSFRVCSPACAKAAVSDPSRFSAAAGENRSEATAQDPGSRLG